jgi:hypothetical protein
MYAKGGLDCLPKASNIGVIENFLASRQKANFFKSRFIL